MSNTHSHRHSVTAICRCIFIARNHVSAWDENGKSDTRHFSNPLSERTLDMPLPSSANYSRIRILLCTSWSCQHRATWRSLTFSTSCGTLRWTECELFRFRRLWFVDPHSAWWLGWVEVWLNADGSGGGWEMRTKKDTKECERMVMRLEYQQLWQRNGTKSSWHYTASHHLLVDASGWPK